MKVHASQINIYSACPRMYYCNYVLGLVPKTESPKLLFGRGVHKGLEAYYTNHVPQEGMAAYDAWLKEQPEVADADLGKALLEEYINYAQNNDDFIAEHVEQQFEVPIWKPDGTQSEIMHVGTWDGVVRDKYGKLWLMEHKTASNFPSELDLRMNRQNRFYLLAAHQIFSEGVRGTVYNVIRKVNPRRAKTPVIFRRLVPCTKAELLATRDQLYRAANRMLTDEYYDPNPGFHCNWMCAYEQLCSCMQEGADFTEIVELMYNKRET